MKGGSAGVPKSAVEVGNPVPVGAEKSVPVGVDKHGTVGEKRPAEELKSTRPQRKRRPNVRFSDYVVDMEGPKAFSAIKSQKPGSMPPDPTLLPLAKDIPIPGSVKAALQSPYADFWKSAFDEEFNSLRAHKTWELTSRALVPR